MAVRLDQARPIAIEELRARRAMTEMALGRRRRRRRPPRQVPPRGQELRYRVLLMAQLSQVEELLDAELLPLLASLTAQVQQQRPDARLDAPADDLARMLERLRVRVAAAVIPPGEIARIAESISRDVSRHNRGQLDIVFEATIGVGLPATEPGIADVLRAFVRENVRRMKNLSNEALDRVEASVLRGFRRGRTNASIAADIQADLGISRRRARLIARDQIASLNGELTQIRQASMGVQEYIWRTAGDERVRPSHAALDGTRQRWDDPPAEGHPGEPINCRCIAEPVLDPLFEGL